MNTKIGVKVRNEVSEPRIRLATRSRRMATSRLDVVGQVREAFGRGARLALLFGMAMGAAVPVGVYRMAHCEVRADWWADPKSVIVAGGLIFSASKVWAWGRMAFRSPYLATGFVLLAEGISVFSNQACLSIGALAYLVAINAVATAAALALGSRG